jgi:MFS family permease
VLAATRNFPSLFAAVFVLLCGHGLQLSLVPLRAFELGWSPGAIGFVGSTYFLGFLLGCATMPRLVVRAGHVRAFSVATSMCGAALLGLVFSNDVWWWSVMRFVTGWAISGAYLIIESWLNEQTTDEARGRVLGAYTAIVLIAMCAGQALVNVGGPLDVEVVAAGSLLLSLAVVPVSASRSAQPKPPLSARISIARVYRTSPAAVAGALLIGLANGVLFTMAPSHARSLGFDVFEASLFMMAVVIGGAIFQWPAGRFSDRHDRRWVMVGVLALGALASLVGAMLVQPVALIGAMLVIGGCTVSIYPICLAHANDRAHENFLEIGTGILLANALGSFVGPLAAPVVMWATGPSGFFIFLALVYLLTIALLLHFIRQHGISVPHPQSFVNVVSTTQGSVELDPRAADSVPAEALDDR